MSSKHFCINTSNTNYLIKETTHQGKKHIVVPVVMMVEGVHNGSHGPLFHPAEELGKFPESWNGIPVVIDHPVNDNGLNISANSPEVIDGPTVGRVYNTTMEGDKLKAEVYVDYTKLNAISPAALNSILNGEPLEVSVGVFTEEDTTSGVWNNERYNSIARSHRPDHLALLPGGTGACSWNDGCGIRANSKKKGGTVNFEVNEQLKQEMVDRIIADNQDNGYATLIDNLRKKVDSMDDESKANYLQEVYSEYLVYKCSSKDGEKYYKQMYAVSDNGDVTLTGNAQEVKQKVEYIPVTMERTKFNNNSKGGKQMSTEKNCGQCMEKVIAIIQSNATSFTASDREWLLQQEEAVLDKLMPKEVKANNNPAEITSEQILKAMSAEDRAALSFGKKQLAERRQKWVDGIQANTSKELWPEETLKTLSDEFLEKLYSSVKTEEVVDYSLNGNSHRMNSNSNSSSVEGLFPVDLEVK